MGKTECQYYCEGCGDCLECYGHLSCLQGYDHIKQLAEKRKQNDVISETESLMAERDEARKIAELLLSDIRAEDGYRLVPYLDGYTLPWGNSDAK